MATINVPTRDEVNATNQGIFKPCKCENIIKSKRKRSSEFGCK